MFTAERQALTPITPPNKPCGGTKPSTNKPIYQDGFQLRKVEWFLGRGRILFSIP